MKPSERIKEIHDEWWYTAGRPSVLAWHKTEAICQAIIKYLDENHDMKSKDIRSKAEHLVDAGGLGIPVYVSDLIPEGKFYLMSPQALEQLKETERKFGVYNQTSSGLQIDTLIVAISHLQDVRDKEKEYGFRRGVQAAIDTLMKLL